MPVKRVQIFKGGTPHINYMYCKGDPNHSGYPFGARHVPDVPVANAHYDGVMNRGNFAAGTPFLPHLLDWQTNNISQVDLAVDDIIEMLIVPTNHFFNGLRLDVTAHDDRMAGATVELEGTLYTPDITDPDNTVTESDVTEITTAATAQSVGPIALDVPSTNIVWLNKAVNGYNTPMYVAPVLRTVNGKDYFYETGAMVLGLRILSLPTGNTNEPIIKISTIRNAIFMSLILHGFECPGFL